MRIAGCLIIFTMLLGASQLTNCQLPQPEQRYPLGCKEPVLTAEQINEINAYIRGKSLLEETFPNSFSWRQNSGNDWLTPIKNQNTCGSCVAFAVVAALECQVRIAEGNPSLPVDLSEQHLFSCGGGSCVSGWYPHRACDYLKDYGIPPESCSPYLSVDNNCNDSCNTWSSQAMRIDDWSYVSGPVPNTDALKAAILQHPIAARMIVYEDFYFYNTGVYQYDGSSAEQGGHYVLLYGWDDSQNCWLAKNSWGTDWGEGGYFRIGYGEAEIGSYATRMNYSVEPHLTNPSIGQVSDGISLTDAESTATLWASGVFDPGGTGIAEVWVEIFKPKFNPATDTAVKLPLTYDAVDTRYEADYSGFTETGDYNLVFFARDNQDRISLPVNAVLYRGVTPDLWEVDDSPEEAWVIITSPTDVFYPQVHNFHDEGDVDWVKFFVSDQPLPFTISILNASPSSDTVISLYSEGNHQAPLFSVDDNHTPGEGELASWISDGTGWYYVKVESADPLIFGTTTGYEILITDDTGANNGLATAISNGVGIKISWEEPQGLGKSLLAEIYGYLIYRADGFKFREEDFRQVNTEFITDVASYSDCTANQPSQIYTYLVYAVTDLNPLLQECKKVYANILDECVEVKCWKDY